jgi:hypothetical protein
VREGEVGRRYVDKLVKVWTKEGVARECAGASNRC